MPPPPGSCGAPFLLEANRLGLRLGRLGRLLGRRLGLGFLLLVELELELRARLRLLSGGVAKGQGWSMAQRRDR